MKLQTQVNSLAKSPQVRRYENAAPYRPGSSSTSHEAIFREIFSKPQHYPVYKVPQKTTTLRPTDQKLPDMHFEEQPREPLQNQKMHEAMQVYRKVSNFYSSPNLEYDAFLQTLVSGKPITISPPSEQVLGEYKRRRDETQRIHEEKLWSEFDVKHMIYVDDPRLSMGMRTSRAGTFLNMMA